MLARLLHKKARSRFGAKSINQKGSLTDCTCQMDTIMQNGRKRKKQELLNGKNNVVGRKTRNQHLLPQLLKQTS